MPETQRYGTERCLLTEVSTSVLFVASRKFTFAHELVQLYIIIPPPFLPTRDLISTEKIEVEVEVRREGKETEA